MVDRQAAPSTSIDIVSYAHQSGMRAPGRWQLPPAEFTAEWLAVAGLILIDIAWAAHIGLTLSVEFLDCAIPLLCVCIIIFFRAVVRSERGALAAEYFALSATVTGAIAVFSYLCCTASWPLVDNELLRLDRMIGFDWPLWFRLLQEHPAIMQVLKIAYHSLFIQCLYFTILLGILLRRTQLRETFWIVFIAGLSTCAGSVVLPAYGPFELFGLNSLGDWIADTKQLRAGSDLHFSLGGLKGVVAFPSFHTTMALVYAYGFRRTGVVGHGIVAINVVMLLAIPFFGGHYVMDMIGGAGVALAVILLVRRVPALRARAEEPAIPMAGQLAQSPA